MNIASVTSTSQVQTQDALSILMLKKALAHEQASAAQMLATLPEPARTSDPAATVGRTIDTFA